MINIDVDLQDVDSCEEVHMSIPFDSNIIKNLSESCIIIDSTPNIAGIQMMDINELNKIISDINCENPGMTAEYLDVILRSVNGDLVDSELIRKISENDFIFKDLSDITWKMSAEEIAACYIATVMKVPFDYGITKTVLDVFEMDEVNDYINWNAVWEQYRKIGFRVFKDNGNTYLIHMK